MKNIFGILSVFRVLRKPMLLCPEKVTLRISKPNTTYNSIIITRTEGMALMRVEPVRNTKSSDKIRDDITEYCIQECTVERQNIYNYFQFSPDQYH